MTKLINDEAAARLNKEKKESALQSLIKGVQVPDQGVQTPDKINPQQPVLNTESNQAMLDDMITKPLTPEDVEARKRAATSVNAVGQLGNLISAFANLAGTTQGNAPWTIPGYKGPDTESWQDRMEKKQQEYASIMNALSSQDWEQAYKEREAQRAQANADREFKMKQEDTEWKRNYTAHRDAIEDAQKQQALDESKRSNLVGERIAQQNANTSRMNAETSQERMENQIKEREAKLYASMGMKPDGTPITKPVKDGSGKVYDLDESALYYTFGRGANGTKASSTLTQLYEGLTPEFKEAYKINNWEDLAKNAAAASSAVSIAMLKDDNIVKEMIDYGILKPKLSQVAPVKPQPTPDPSKEEYSIYGK